MTVQHKRLTVIFKREFEMYKGFSERLCMECKSIVVDGMYVSHAKKYHNTGRVKLE